MANVSKAKKSNPKLDETRDFIMMLRECGVMEYSGDGIQVKLLPKALESSLMSDIPELEHEGLMGDTIEKLSRSKQDYDKDLFWSR